jgi:2'-5' RNA ligase
MPFIINRRIGRDMVKEQYIRSFIAVELPAELKAVLGKYRDEMAPASREFVKWVSPDSIHVTLKFLGNISHGMVDKIALSIEQACTGMTPFTLETDILGGFPNLKQPRVLWLGMHGDIDKMKLLQTRIDDGLVDLGFEKEKREFTAHITLARIREKAVSSDRLKFGALITGRSTGFKHTIQVEGVNLMQSRLQPGGAVYNRLAMIKLNG